MLPAILGMTHEEVTALRQQGLTLAQIAERQQVDPQLLIDALAAPWRIRIDERLALGMLTADEAAALKEEVAVRAKAMVNQAPLGGMRGLAAGAGPGSNAGGCAGGAECTNDGQPAGPGATNRRGGGNGIHAPGTGGGAVQGTGQGGGAGFRGGRGMGATSAPVTPAT